MKLLVTTVVLVAVCSAQLQNLDINQFCLTCCGAPPCCGYCGMDPNILKPLTKIRRDGVNPSLADLLHNGGINVMCPECCGPPPCCSTCGLDFNNLKDLLAVAVKK